MNNWSGGCIWEKNTANLLLKHRWKKSFGTSCYLNSYLKIQNVNKKQYEEQIYISSTHSTSVFTDDFIPHMEQLEWYVKSCGTQS